MCWSLKWNDCSGLVREYVYVCVDSNMCICACVQSGACSLRTWLTKEETEYTDKHTKMPCVFLCVHVCDLVFVEEGLVQLKKSDKKIYFFGFWKNPFIWKSTFYVCVCVCVIRCLLSKDLFENLPLPRSQVTCITAAEDLSVLFCFPYPSP